MKERSTSSAHFLLGGQPLRVEIRQGELLSGLCPITVRDGTLHLEVPHGRLDLAAASVRSFFYEEARRRIGERLTERRRDMAQEHGAVVIRDQKTLWGSCSTKSGTLSFSVRLAMAPPEVLDYLVVHELAHFRWARHGVRFWERVARFSPEFRHHRRWLRENAWRLKLPSSAENLLPFLIQ